MNNNNDENLRQVIDIQYCGECQGQGINCNCDGGVVFTYEPIPPPISVNLTRDEINRLCDQAWHWRRLVKWIKESADEEDTDIWEFLEDELGVSASGLVDGH